MVRVRFAPSPTGHIHIGNARTALFNWLFAKHEAGTFVLRIEDTDVVRSTQASEEAILEDLIWLGLEWDEGPNKGGHYGPYRQSERMEIYKAYANKLLKEDKAYLCYCTLEELEQDKQKSLLEGRMPIYSGRCRNLTNKERSAFEREGRRPVIRFRAPEKTVRILDLVRGEVTFAPQSLNDLVLIRSNGKAAYNFAVVIDDALMQITHILRGEDHLSNTPKQVLLYEAFSFPIPQFAHMSMILGPDHTRLSKRHGVTSIRQYRQMGILPEALINYLALLGWSAENQQEVMCLSELVKEFSLDRLSKSSAIFDPKKLLWLNGNHIRSADLSRLALLCKDFIPKGWEEQINAHGRVWWEGVTDSIKTKLESLVQVKDWAFVYFDTIKAVDEEAKRVLEDQDTQCVIRIALDEFRQESTQALSPEVLTRLLKAISKRSGKKGRAFYMSLRVALTGSTRGPEIDKFLPLLGKQKIVERLRRSLL